MAGIHRLQHVECLFAAALADDDAIGPHSQRILDQIALANLALALDVGGARFQAADMRLLQLQFGGILDGDEALVGAGYSCDKALSSVVLPLPVPPEMITEILPWTAACRTSTIAGRSAPISTSRSMVNGRSANLRIETSGPSTAIGRMATLTREPSGRRASTIGDDSSTRRPTAATILLMMRSRCASSLKWTLVSSSLPNRSTKHLLVRVDQDVGDRRILEQRLDRAVADHLVDNLFDENV